MLKREIADHFDRLAPSRLSWKAGNRFYYAYLEALCQSVIPPGQTVLELGCGTGDLLAAVQPRLGVGVDVSRGMLDVARRLHPSLAFLQADAEAIPLGGTFDYIILSDLLGHAEDVFQLFQEVRRLSTPATRVLITGYNFLWQPLLELGERLGVKMPQQQQNWLGLTDVENLLRLCDFEAVQVGRGLLMPWRVPVVGGALNAIADWPGVKHMSLSNFIVAAATPRQPQRSLSCSVVIPTRNEVGNIAGCVERIPEMGTGTEILFVDGASTDGTIEAIEAVVAQCEGRRSVRLLHQVPKTIGAGHDPALMLPHGKGDAVRKGFDAASGDVLMILDADLTVPPEELPKFFRVVAEGKARFVNGTRLVYPMEDEAMKFLNMVGNKSFSLIFTWLLGQSIKDTLCGTKVVFKTDYERIKANRAYFGEFDPFGDFDLLFGAARLRLPIVEMPVRYRRRMAGETKVRVFKHGILLVQMSAVAFQKFKLIPWWRRLTGRAEAPLL